MKQADPPPVKNPVAAVSASKAKSASAAPQPPNALQWAEATLGAAAIGLHAAGQLSRVATDKNLPFTLGKIPFGNTPIVSKPLAQIVLSNPPPGSAIPKVTVELDMSTHGGVIGKLGDAISTGFVLLPIKGASSTPGGVTYPEGFSQIGVGRDTAGRITLVGSTTLSKKVLGGEPSLVQGQPGALAKASGNEGVQVTVHVPNSGAGPGRVLEVDISGSVGTFAQAGIHIPLGAIAPKGVQAIGGLYVSGATTVTFKLEWDRNKPDLKKLAEQPALSPSAAPASSGYPTQFPFVPSIPALTPSPSTAGKGQAPTAKSLGEQVADWMTVHNQTFVDNMEYIGEQINEAAAGAANHPISPLPAPTVPAWEWLLR